MRKNETLQVDDEVGQLAHQDDLQITVLISKKKNSKELISDKEGSTMQTSSTSLEEYSPSSSKMRIFTKANLNHIISYHM